jgi:hypothetical protein
VEAADEPLSRTETHPSQSQRTGCCPAGRQGLLPGPLSLRAVQQAMVDLGSCRRYINQNINIIRRMLKWAVENELLPGSVHHGLQTLSPLKAGRSAAGESDPVRPVPDACWGASPDRSPRWFRCSASRACGLGKWCVCAASTPPASSPRAHAENSIAQRESGCHS